MQNRRSGGWWAGVGLGAMAVLLVLVAVAGASGGLAAPVAGPLARPAADPFILGAFQRVWNRTDWVVKNAGVARAWYWGPDPHRAVTEVFQEAPGHVRVVQYFDKSRMEPNVLAGQPTPPPGSQWAVTNGLLVVELISGQEQLGVSRFVAHGDANIPLASDVDDPTGPTYTTFRVLATTPAGNHPAPNRTGQAVVALITSRDGQVRDDSSKTTYGISNAHYVAETQHNLPGVFWAFLNAVGPVRNDDGSISNQTLTDPWFFATGLPISEAYWARVKIAGQQKDVLIQAFERRILTYNPTNPAGFQVEMGNVGLHYFDWRYPDGLPAPIPTQAP